MDRRSAERKALDEQIRLRLRVKAEGTVFSRLEEDERERLIEFARRRKLQAAEAERMGAVFRSRTHLPENVAEILAELERQLEDDQPPENGLVGQE